MIIDPNRLMKRHFRKLCQKCVQFWNVSMSMDAVEGLPPSWARAPDAEQTLPRKLLERFGEDVAASGMKTWRRKLLWFPADTKAGLPVRPAFYGSWSKKR